MSGSGDRPGLAVAGRSCPKFRARPAVRGLPVQAVSRYKEYVALGDSWTADVVLLDGRGVPDVRYAPLGCAQSKVNYPKLVEQTVRPATFRDASCGAAATEHFTTSQSVLLGTNKPQFSRLTGTTDLVTVGIGGNDAGIAGAGLDCLGLVPLEPITDIGAGLPLGGCKAKWDGIAVGIPAHPNSAGAEAQARAVIAQLGR